MVNILVKLSFSLKKFHEHLKFIIQEISLTTDSFSVKLHLYMDLEVDSIR